jgi:hypothetical protein
LSTIALIDTRFKIPGESIGSVVSTHETIRAAFKANEAFQKRMRDSGVKDHVPTKIVTLKVRLGDGEHVNPGLHFFQEGKKYPYGQESWRQGRAGPGELSAKVPLMLQSFFYYYILWCLNIESTPYGGLKFFYALRFDHVL